MNCKKCNTLLNNSEICPNCHYDNSLETLEDASELEMFDDSEVEKIEEFMEPPRLKVNDEQTDTSNNSDIGVASTKAETYAPEEKKDDLINENETGIDDIDVAIEIPAVKKGEAAPDEEILNITEDENEVNQAEVTDVVTNQKKRFKLRINTSKTMPQFLSILLMVVFLIVGIVVGKTFFSTTIYATNRNNMSNTANVITDGKNNTTIAGNFSFKVPANYVYDRVDKGLVVYEKNDNWRIYIRGEKGNYDNIATAKTSIKETLNEADVSVINIKEIKVNKHNYVTIEGTTKTQNRLISFTKANDEYVFYIEIVTKDNIHDYEILKIVDEIVSSSKYQKKVSTMENISVYDVSDVLIKAANTYSSLKK